MVAVKIYTTEWCGFCKAAKAFFKENKIVYREIRVDKDTKSAEDMIKKSGQTGVPVIEIGGKIIVGFDQPALKKALKLK
ncbi:MAG: NrdH-redoxin [Candidatus Aenigmarchaeota archaeon]|nr:NrdH-redoxin [Candidatus Aenigmarchaeota archaeon]